MSLAANSVAGAGVGSMLGPIGTIAGGVIGAGANLLGDAFQAQSSALNVQQQEDYQTQMADTQYQRGVADMRSAGLNPLAMFSGGGSPAPSPSGSVSQPEQLGNVGPGAVAGMAAAGDVEQQQAANASTQLALRSQEADIAVKNATAIKTLASTGIGTADSPLRTSTVAKATMDEISANQDAALWDAQNGMGKPYWLGKALAGTPIPGAISTGLDMAVPVLGQALSAGGFNGAADLAAAAAGGL